MRLVKHPRLLARIGGLFYVAIIAFALFAYLHVRGPLIVSGDMPQKARNLLAHQSLYRLGFSAAAIVVICNLPLGFILYELLKIVNERVARLALMFIIVSTTLEAVNLMNYISPLLTLTTPELQSAFGEGQREALARSAIRLFGYGFSASLIFFGVFCLLTGYLIFRSRFLPRILGVLMAAAGIVYWIESFGTFLAVQNIPPVLLASFVAENALALWLLLVGVNETRWREQAGTIERS